MQLLQQIQGLDVNKATVLNNRGNQLANLRLGFQSGSNNLASQNAQLQAQAKRDSKSGAGSAIGAGLNVVGSLFSDIRLKENLMPVGKLDNGLTVYVGNYIGQKPTQLFLLAQEVQKVKPEAVGEEDGFLYVNYKEAVK
jgi:hypothetical protein